MYTTTPTDLAHDLVNTMLSHFPAAFDGDADGVHQARVATRRLREVVPLVTAVPADHISKTLRTAGREFGRVRELDVMSNLVDSLSERIPITAATELHALRQLIAERRRKARRSMVKRVEQLDLWAVQDMFGRQTRLRRWLTQAPYLSTPGWVDEIWTRIRGRSADAAEFARRAPAVYLPRRTHRARVGVKRLRYALEIAAATGVWRPMNALKELRKIQQVLGEEHDLQVLIDLLDSSASRDGIASPGGSLLRGLLTGEIDRHHAEYSRRRNRIPLIADACARRAAHRRNRTTLPLVAASVLAPVLVESVGLRKALIGSH